jgi:serine/threonine protein kinase
LGHSDLVQIGRFEVLGELGRGGMGAVYRARDPQLDRELALKVLLNGAVDPRFAQEAKACAALQHPGIVTVYEHGAANGRPYLAMELVQGESLHERLRRDGPLPEEEAIALTIQLCEAIGYAHGRGVIHRDLKPHNVLLTRDGEVKVTDFGLGKVEDQTVSLTKTGQIMGTPAYMPPEQAEGDKAAVGPPSDLYSLGATLYAMLTGRPPFEAATPLNVIFAVLKTPPQPPSAHRPGLSKALDRVCLRCLAKSPADRYPDAAALAEDLRRSLGSQTASASPRVGAWIAGAIVAAGSLVAGALVLRGPSASPSTPAPTVSRRPARSPETTPETPPDSPAARSPDSRPSQQRFLYAPIHFNDWELGRLPRRRSLNPLRPEAWTIERRGDTDRALFFHGDDPPNNGFQDHLQLNIVARALEFEVRLDSWYGDIYLWPVFNSKLARGYQVRLLPNAGDGGTEGIYVYRGDDPSTPEYDARAPSLTLNTWHRVRMRYDKAKRLLNVEVDDRPWIVDRELPPGFEGVTAIGFHADGWIDNLRYR